MPIVSVQAAGRYDPEVLDRAVAAHFEALDVAGDLRPGMHVLLKPNLLAARDPALAVTTHPGAVGRCGALAARARHIADHAGGQPRRRLQPRHAPKALCGLRPSPLEGLLTLNLDVSSGRRDGFTLITPFCRPITSSTAPSSKPTG